MEGSAASRIPAHDRGWRRHAWVRRPTDPGLLRDAGSVAVVRTVEWNGGVIAGGTQFFESGWSAATVHAGGSHQACSGDRETRMAKRNYLVDG
jgi:hypothetical protein